MRSSLALQVAMRTLVLLIALVAAPFASAAGQDSLAPEGTTIAVADVAGLAPDQLTADLHAEITALGGTPLRRQRLQELVARIEREKPDMVAAVRSEMLPDGSLHVSFVVARISDDPELLANINARYIVESVSVTGAVRQDYFAQPVRDRLQGLVGRRLDTQEVEDAMELLEGQFAGFNGFRMTRRFERGSQPGQIRLVFDVTLSPEWEEGLALLGPSETRRQPKLVYNADQGWSALLNVTFGAHHNQASFGAAFANNDESIEEYSGFRFRFSRNRLGTDRVGFSVGLSAFTQKWRDATLAAVNADPSIPEPYETRVTLEPRITVRPIYGTTITGGMLLATLDPLGAGQSSDVTAAVLRISSARSLVVGAGRHYAAGGFEVHVADYTRNEGTLGYEYTQGRNRVQATWLFGGSGGEVPLFERFVLGDTNTLRGWNKFELSPAGGTRMFHQSLEYRYRLAALPDGAGSISLGVFLDAGSVWNETGRSDRKYSLGGGLQNSGWFATVAVPLQAGQRRAVFMAGLGF